MAASPNKYTVLPGFRLTLGFTIFYLSLIVLIPLSTLFLKTAALSWNEFLGTVTAPRVLFAFRLSFFASLVAALLNTVFGLLVAWVLVRYRFPFQKMIDGMVDLPFALPTAVAGIALTALYAESGWIGRGLAAFGIKAAYTPLGITIALTFVGLPFVVRSVQPILAELPPEHEEAAACLGAGRLKTFWKVILPELKPALWTGFALAFARALGEYGSVVFISGNMPFKTEITPLLIMTKLDQYEYSQATAIAVVMLLASFLILLFINLINWRTHRRMTAS
ncbi:MAG TPA: sulfate ABC transporter permease subunit CysT [Deltaproteobacteria bacterium]|nr:sulfate ABC transporter permease subunit CysT [Deltaproteobacteria bacterium]